MHHRLPLDPKVLATYVGEYRMAFARDAAGKVVARVPDQNGKRFRGEKVK